MVIASLAVAALAIAQPAPFQLQHLVLTCTYARDYTIVPAGTVTQDIGGAGDSCSVFPSGSSTLARYNVVLGEDTPPQYFAGPYWYEVDGQIPTQSIPVMTGASSLFAYSSMGGAAIVDGRSNGYFPLTPSANTYSSYNQERFDARILNHGDWANRPFLCPMDTPLGNRLISGTGGNCTGDLGFLPAGGGPIRQYSSDQSYVVGCGHQAPQWMLNFQRARQLPIAQRLVIRLDPESELLVYELFVDTSYSFIVYPATDFPQLVRLYGGRWPDPPVWTLLERWELRYTNPIAALAGGGSFDDTRIVDRLDNVTDALTSEAEAPELDLLTLQSEAASSVRSSIETPGMTLPTDSPGAAAFTIPGGTILGQSVPPLDISLTAARSAVALPLLILFGWFLFEIAAKLWTWLGK